MNKLPEINNICELKNGDNPVFDAWFYTFKAENNIEYTISPTTVASDEQLGFMVALIEGHIYAPCSDDIFYDLIDSTRNRKLSPRLHQQYNQIWRNIIRLCRTHISDKILRRTIINYCRLRFMGSLLLNVILPSRVVKRLITTFISQLKTEDPWIKEKHQSFESISELFLSEKFQKNLTRLPADITMYTDIKSLRKALDFTELTRLIYLAGHTHNQLQQIITQYKNNEPINPFEKADQFIPIIKTFFNDENTGKTFLYICDLEGGFALDLFIANVLLRLGHKIILAVKEFPIYFAPTIWEVENNPLLTNTLLHAHILKETAASKNTLLKYLHEKRLVIISDGTGEQLNLYRTSITFARAWKESDLILAKGSGNKEIILGTKHQFTRDILCFWEENNTIQMQCKPHPSYIYKFSEAMLTHKAQKIINLMRNARNEGKTVMFYSCIIGSIPGEISTAIEVARTFIHNLRERLEGVFIINPAEYFEKGMDGDDLMYMWEQVQRSGLINIWRFQSMEDIETSFTLMGRKVPPIWSGKDATFSIGCTKEMRIALDIQQSHPELQITGPSPEKFFRKNTYGVGKFHGNSFTIANHSRIF